MSKVTHDDPAREVVLMNEVRGERRGKGYGVTE